MPIIELNDNLYHATPVWVDDEPTESLEPLLDEHGDMIPASICICHAWSANECSCGAWDISLNTEWE